MSFWRWITGTEKQKPVETFKGITPEEFATANDAEVCQLIMIPVCGEWLKYGEYEYYAELHWAIGTGVRRRL